MSPFFFFLLLCISIYPVVFDAFVKAKRRKKDAQRRRLEKERETRDPIIFLLLLLFHSLFLRFSVSGFSGYP